MTDTGIVAVAKRNLNKDRMTVLSTGYHAVLNPVSILLVQEVQSQIKDPEVPDFMNEDKGRTEPNPNDPTYLRELAEASETRSMRALEAIIMFGVDLVDGEDGTSLDINEIGTSWIKRLKYLEMRGILDLSGYDLDDEMTREFLFKKWVAVGAKDLESITRLSGVSEEDIEEAVKTFRGNTE